MENTQALQLKKYIREKKFEELKKFLLKIIQKPWLKEKKGKVATELGVAYMDAHSAINKNAVDFLYDASSILEKIEKKEMKASDSAKIDELRNKIREL